MNKPGDDAFIKVDCGKLTDENEVFGMSGAYQGAYEGSALNNFVVRMSQEPEALGIVLLDEIEKASRGVIHGLYQVIDKGEWTNKRLVNGKGTHSETVSCHNLVFIMTTNAADKLICEKVKASDLYYTLKQTDDIEAFVSTFEGSTRNKLRQTYPFTDAFIARVGRVVPFIPMANGNANGHPLLGEMMTVAKLLIERQQEKFMSVGKLDVKQVVSASVKHSMAKIIVSEAIPEAGVRSIQKGVETKMGKRVVNALCLEKGGIKPGAHVHYSASEEEKKIDFRVEQFGARESSIGHGNWANDDDIFG
jgi:ATP-dependent Clp protease ATP-binding subunit ClpA